LGERLLGLFSSTSGGPDFVWAGRLGLKRAGNKVDPDAQAIKNKREEWQWKKRLLLHMEIGFQFLQDFVR
jgi:hypothetical protein